jgi:NitT/TauT family transport system permease protein
MISPLFFSAPSAVVDQFLRLIRDGTLLNDIIFSGRNFLVGFFISLTVGIVLGMAIGWYRRLRLIVDPVLNALNSTPRIAMVPLVIIWFGVEWPSKVFTVFFFAFFPIIVNTIAGVRSLDSDLIRIARSYCATDWQIFKTIALPGSVPFILTGIRQGVALGLIGVVIGEMFGGSQGVGFLVAYGGQTFQTDTLFVGVTVISTAGILLTLVAERLERRFSRWRPER